MDFLGPNIFVNLKYFLTRKKLLNFLDPTFFEPKPDLTEFFILILLIELMYFDK